MPNHNRLTGALIALLAIASAASINAPDANAKPIGVQTMIANGHIERIVHTTGSRKRSRSRRGGFQRRASQQHRHHAVLPGVASALIAQRKCLDQLFPRDKPCPLTRRRR